MAQTGNRYWEGQRSINSAPARTRKREKVSYTRQYDFVLLFLTIGIALFGVIMIYSAGYYTAVVKHGKPFLYIRTQLFCLVLGSIIMVVISRVDYQQFMQRLFHTRLTLVHIAYLTAIILQFVVLFAGTEKNSAKRWLKIGPVQFQPSEISKIAAILFIAYVVYLNRRSLDSIWGFIRICVYIGPLILFIALENLSSAIIVAGILFGMCFVASKKKAYFLAIALIAVAGVLGIIFMGSAFRADRVQMWLDVENHPRAFQIRQGLYAVASGGLFGTGLGQSMQKSFIPEAYNDMIFSVICEELGVVGASLVLLAFLVLLWRIVMIACHAPDLFGTMICVGIMVQLAVQVIINVAVVTNSIPNTGIPLPLISYGGTSEMIIMVEIGMVLSVSRQIKQK